MKVNAEKWLWGWGIVRPTEDDVQVATRYLRQRWGTYSAMWVLCVVASTFDFVPGLTNDVVLRLCLPVAAGVLLAEVVLGARRQQGAVRRASLVPRSRRDLVPVWASALEVALFSAAVVAALLSSGNPLVPLVGAVVSVGLVEGTIRLAVLRAPLGEGQVDRATHAASCRMALGSGFVLLGFCLSWATHTWAPGGFGLAVLLGTALAGVLVVFLPTLEPRRATG